MSDGMKILSCGAGVQSSALLLMSCVGELPKLDAAIFADTGWEPPEVYDYLGWLKEKSEEHGIPFYIVDNGRNIRDDALAMAGHEEIDMAAPYQERFISIPMYIKNHDGTDGLVRRQCTNEYKIKPVRKKIRELLGVGFGERVGKDVEIEHWFGITADEIRRCRMSPDKWMIYRYPLIEDMTPPMRRSDCMAWIKRHGFREPVRSSCVGCPYKSNAEWREMKKSAPDQWADAVDFDKKIRTRPGKAVDMYLHVDLVPLGEVDLSTEEERGQGMLFECSGMCGT